MKNKSESELLIDEIKNLRKEISSLKDRIAPQIVYVPQIIRLPSFPAYPIYPPYYPTWGQTALQQVNQCVLTSVK